MQASALPPLGFIRRVNGDAVMNLGGVAFGVTLEINSVLHSAKRRAIIGVIFSVGLFLTAAALISLGTLVIGSFGGALYLVAAARPALWRRAR